uniref:Uncharacterized protein n=1 Tax=Strigamia maritima TaxID=126957 RepID=T1JNQ9_STRMM
MLLTCGFAIRQGRLDPFANFLCQDVRQLISPLREGFLELCDRFLDIFGSSDVFSTSRVTDGKIQGQLSQEVNSEVYTEAVTPLTQATTEVIHVF